MLYTLEFFLIPTGCDNIVVTNAIDKIWENTGQHFIHIIIILKTWYVGNNPSLQSTLWRPDQSHFKSNLAPVYSVK